MFAIRVASKSGAKSRDYRAESRVLILLSIFEAINLNKNFFHEKTGCPFRFNASTEVLAQVEEIQKLMKIQTLFLFFIIISVLKTGAQIPDSALAGEYYLEGVMEVGSGILLKPDHTFLMFFSYGSLDKSGMGTWAVKNNTVILNSDPRPANDFKLISSKKTGVKGITIKISDPNTDILRYMACVISGKGFSDTTEADENGMIHFDRSGADSIGLVHEMFSDRLCYFDISRKDRDASKSDDNYFEFGIERWIMNIYCENLVLTIHDGYLQGSHPLLEEGGIYTYRKSK